MPGEMPIPNLGLSFADATNISARSGAPVVFGASNIGRGSAGGTTNYGTETDVQSSNPDARSTVAPLSGGQGGAAGGGGGLLDSILPAVVSAGLGYGLNGGQVQSPSVQQQLYGQDGAGATALPANSAGNKSASMMPGPIALAGIALAVGVFIFMARG